MNKKFCVIYAPVETYSGYGSNSRNIIKSLISLKGNEWDIKVLSCKWGITSFNFLDENPEWAFLKEYILPTNQLPKQPDIWMMITVPNEFQRVGKYNIGITPVIETTICDPTWIDGCNKMDEIWVSADHGRQVLEGSKFEKRDKNTNQLAETIELKKPVKTLFEGANTDVFKPLEPKEITNINLDAVEEKFNFLFVGHFMQGDMGEDRKNVGLLIKTFLETFKNKKNKPGLILKTCLATSSVLDRDEILKRIDNIRKTVKGDLPNVYLLHGNFSDSEVNELYNHPKVKAMANLTKGEGFGRPLLEFSLVKKPVITTGWSGHLDFLNKEFAILLPGKLEKVHPSAVVPNMILAESSWFSVDILAVNNALTQVYENYEKYAELAKRQSYFSKTNFSLDKMTEKLSEYLKDVEGKLPQEVALVLPKMKLPTLKKIEPLETVK